MPPLSTNPPVLFLDVDGVLNTRPGSLDRDKLDLLREIIAVTGCLVCLSSSWRLNERQHSRISHEIPIWNTTPQIKSVESLDWSSGEHRRHEILAFLSNHRYIDRIAILDDYLYGWGPLRPAVVTCDASKGLGSLEFDACVSKLTTPNLVPLTPYRSKRHV